MANSETGSPDHPQVLHLPPNIFTARILLAIRCTFIWQGWHHFRLATALGSEASHTKHIPYATAYCAPCRESCVYRKGNNPSSEGGSKRPSLSLLRQSKKETLCRIVGRFSSDEFSDY